MFGKNAAKAAQTQAAEDRAATNTAITQAAQPTPLQQAWEKANLDFLDWESGKNGPVDVMKAPGLGTARSLFDFARTKQENQKQGIGALRLGLNASDPNLAADMATLNDERRQQDAAGQLENAVALKTAEAHGSVLPLSQLNTSRNLSVAGLRSGNYQYAQNRADELKRNSGLWATFRPLAQSFAQGAGQAAMYA